MKKICVFCSASDAIDEVYYESAKEIGKLIAKNNFGLVYGGSTLGLMGEVSKSAKQNGAYVLGIMPEKLHNMIGESGNCTDFIVAKEMRDRKSKLDSNSDGVIALAGGFGTLEELAEIIVQKHLGYIEKPIVILNTNNFYSSLINFFDEIIEKHFAPLSTRDMYYVANSPEEAIEYIKSYVPNLKPKKFNDIYCKK